MREYTNKMLDMIDEGLIDRDTLILACLGYMSENEVKDMAETNGFLIDEDDDMSWDSNSVHSPVHY